MFRKLLAVSALLVLTACSPAPDEATGSAPAESAAAQTATAESVAAPATEVASNTARPAASGSNDNYQQGLHYERFTNAQGTSSAPDKIEVAEVFWYGCQHCYSFEPYLSEWQKSLGPDISFVKIPVMWNPTNEIHARLFYTAQALGILDQAQGDIFQAIHTKGQMLASESAQRDFITSRYDISVEDFDKAYRSFSVNGKLQQAKNWTARYQIRSVPVLIINGKYATVGTELRDFDQILDVADELIERERAEL
jgi:protein dithiol oxidoreductase (disulfide-forming)